MNETKLRAQVDRAAKAEALLRDPIMVEAFEALDREFVSAWKESAITDTEAREHIYRLLQALDALKGHFRQVLEDGKLAKDRLKL